MGTRGTEIRYAPARSVVTLPRNRGTRHSHLGGSRRDISESGSDVVGRAANVASLRHRGPEQAFATTATVRRSFITQGVPATCSTLPQRK